MNPNDLIFQAISNLTGGLITDMTTAIIGILCLEFIVFGGQELMALLGSVISNPTKRGLVMMKMKGGVGRLEMEKEIHGYEVPYYQRVTESSESHEHEDPEDRLWWA